MAETSLPLQVSEPTRHCLDVAQKVQLAVTALCGTLIVLAVSPDPASQYHRPLDYLRSTPGMSMPGDLRAEMQENQDKYVKRLGLMEAQVLEMLRARGSFPQEKLGQPFTPVRVRVPDDGQIGSVLSVAGQAMERARVLHPSPAAIGEALGWIPPGRSDVRIFYGWELDRSSGSVAIGFEFERDGKPWPFPQEVRDEVDPEIATLNYGLIQLVSEAIRGSKLDIDGFAGLPEAEVSREWQLHRIELIDSLSGTIARLQDTLAPVWAEVRSETHEDAIRRLEARISSAHSNLAIFGLSIDQGLAGVGGPLLLISLLLYLALHLIHLTPLARRDPGEISTYPWPPLFPGLSGILAVIALLIVLPGTALVLLALRVREASQLEAGTKGYNGWNIALSVLAFLAAGAVVRLILALRGLNRTESMPVEADKLTIETPAESDVGVGQ